MKLSDVNKAAIVNAPIHDVIDLAVIMDILLSTAGVDSKGENGFNIFTFENRATQKQYIIAAAWSPDKGIYEIDSITVRD